MDVLELKPHPMDIPEEIKHTILGFENGSPTIYEFPFRTEFVSLFYNDFMGSDGRRWEVLYFDDLKHYDPSISENIIIKITKYRFAKGVGIGLFYPSSMGSTGWDFFSINAELDNYFESDKTDPNNSRITFYLLNRYHDSEIFQQIEDFLLLQKL